MAAASDKLERLMNLTAALLDAERPLTADEHRRPGDRLPRRQGGLPAHLRARQGRAARDGHPHHHGGDPGQLPRGDRLPIDRSDYELPDPGLDPDELAALRLALQAVRVGEQSGDGSEALWKLGGAVEADGGPGPVGDVAVASLPTDPALVPLFSAVLERRVARFTYAGGGGDADRVVEPWRLDFRRGRWYLTAHDHDRGEERNFRLDRIRGPVVLDEPGTFTGPPAEVAAEPDQPWAFGEGEAVTAVLRVDGEQARWALDQLGEESVMEVADDGEHHLRGARHLVARVPVVRAQLPRPRRGAGPTRPARRRGRLARRAGGGRMSRPLTAQERLRRMLAIVPWVAGQPDGATVEEICRRFDLAPDQLQAYLDTVFMVGVHPYTPDALVDVVVDHDRVRITLPDFFTRPLRLTPAQAFALLAAGRSLQAVPGADAEGPLARGLAKLAATLGTGSPAVVEVDLGEAAGDSLSLLQQAVTERRSVEIDYYSYGRDVQEVRRVDPWRVQADRASGTWRRGATAATPSGCSASTASGRSRSSTRRSNGPTGRPPPGLPARRRRPPVVLDLSPGAAWVVGQYPVEQVEERPDGSLRVTLAIAARPWLERLLLRLGPDARVVEAPPALAGAGAAAARRVLERYER